MNSFIPFFMFCMLSETVVSVSVSADRPSPINGDPVTLTCDITGFSAPASWRYSTTDTVLTSCLPGGPCSPTSLGKYSFSANASAIVVQISSFASSDDFGWKCQHNVDTAVFKFVFKISVSVDRPSADQVIFTCSIAGFSVPASWINNATGAVLTTCRPGGPCSPASSGNYSFSANASAIVVQISPFASSDDFGWRCEHNNNTSNVTNVFTSTPSQGILSGGLSLGTQCVIICIFVVIFQCTGCKHAYNLGLGLGLILGITFIFGCIIIVILKFTGTITNEKEVGLGLGLGLGIPCLIAGILAVIFIFFTFSLSEGIPKRVEIGKGILTGLLFASVIGIIVVYCMYHKLKREMTYKKSKTINTGSSAVSREQVSLQMENKGVKTEEEERPPAVHTRTQNKVKPNTNSKKTNDRQQPVPPANTGFEDTPTFCRLPQPPQNGEIKDRSLRGISGTIDDKQDLASEIPRPNRLSPLTPKQTTVQKEDASEEPKKKKKKKKKKDQMNVETPEKQNGETDPRDN